MKPTLATIIMVMAILALAVGSFAMARMMGPGDHPNCLAAIPGSPRCFGGMDPFQFAVTHISALLGASLGIAGSLAGMALALLMLLAWLAIPDAADASSTTAGHSRNFVEGETESAHKQRHWISLLEKRDPSLYCAVNG